MRRNSPSCLRERVHFTCSRLPPIICASPLDSAKPLESYRLWSCKYWTPRVHRKQPSTAFVFTNGQHHGASIWYLLFTLIDIECRSTVRSLVYAHYNPGLIINIMYTRKNYPCISINNEALLAAAMRRRWCLNATRNTNSTRMDAIRICVGMPCVVYVGVVNHPRTYVRTYTHMHAHPFIGIDAIVARSPRTDACIIQ